MKLCWVSPPVSPAPSQEWGTVVPHYPHLRPNEVGFRKATVYPESLVCRPCCSGKWSSPSWDTGVRPSTHTGGRSQRFAAALGYVYPNSVCQCFQRPGCEPQRRCCGSWDVLNLSERTTAMRGGLCQWEHVRPVDWQKTGGERDGAGWQAWEGALPTYQKKWW